MKIIFYFISFLVIFNNINCLSSKVAPVVVFNSNIRLNNQQIDSLLSGGNHTYSGHYNFDDNWISLCYCSWPDIKFEKFEFDTLSHLTHIKGKVVERNCKSQNEPISYAKLLIGNRVDSILSPKLHINLSSSDTVKIYRKHITPYFIYDTDKKGEFDLYFIVQDITTNLTVLYRDFPNKTSNPELNDIVAITLSKFINIGKLLRHN